MEPNKGLFVKEVRVHLKASLRLSKNAIVQLENRSLDAAYQILDDHTHQWSINPPSCIGHGQTLNIQLYRRSLGMKILDKTVQVSGQDLHQLALETSELDIVYRRPYEQYDVLVYLFKEVNSPEGVQLESSTDNILKLCPRFRILVIGKAGVGKSSLINNTFGVDTANVSDDEPGVSNIDQEITSAQNERFVVHDSNGFEPGETTHLDIVKKFVQNRTKRPELKDRLHAIWLCTEVPTTGGRVFESGDEDFIRADFKHVPVIVVFTKYDLLIRSLNFKLAGMGELTKEERAKEVERRAEEAFQRDCVETLQDAPPNVSFVKVSNKLQYRDTLASLVEHTVDKVSHYVAEEASLTSGIAQRISSDVKISTALAVGKKRYWSGLVSSTDFPGRTLKDILQVIHDDIIMVWNLHNPDMYLLSESFKAKMTELVAELDNRDAVSPSKVLAGGITTLSAAAGIAATVPPSLPIVIPVIATIVCATWAYRVYQRTHGVLRCLIAYIVDLTLIIKIIFDNNLRISGSNVVSREAADAAFETYEASDIRPQLHYDIRRFVDELDMLDRLGSKKTIIKIEELLNHSRNASLSD